MATFKHLPHRLAFQLAGRISLRRMNAGDATEKQVGSAIARALQASLEPAERYWRDSIESVRTSMSKDDTVLAYTDYGGSGESDPGEQVTRTIAEVQRYSVPTHQGIALHLLVRDLRPNRCLELGTCLGISSAYIASALDLNEHGSLTTLEGGKDLSRVASINFSRLGLGRTRFVTGRFRDTLPETLPDVAPVDFACIDGHHDGTALTSYFELILQHSARRAVFVLDDIRWSRDMRDAWRFIRNHPHVTAALDLLPFGICVTGERQGGGEQ